MQLLNRRDLFDALRALTVLLRLLECGSGLSNVGRECSASLDAFPLGDRRRDA